MVALMEQLNRYLIRHLKKKKKNWPGSTYSKVRGGWSRDKFLSLFEASERLSLQTSVTVLIEVILPQLWDGWTKMGNCREEAWYIHFQGKRWTSLWNLGSIWVISSVLRSLFGSCFFKIVFENNFWELSNHYYGVLWKLLSFS